MASADAIASPTHNSRWRLLATLLILGAAAWHIAWLAFHCPLDLSPDEAHYWDWSRHLDWSYYSKGPLVAWLIRAGLEIAGPWAEQLTGNAALAVRLPAVLCGSLLLVSLYVLTKQVYDDDRLAFAVVALALTMPMITAASLLMTIDSPYIGAWGWALVLVHRAIFRGSAWCWPAAGLVIGLGILAKYTMVVFLPSLGLFLLTSADYRRLLIRPGFWIMTAIAALSCLPILIWNAQHEWVTFKHVNTLAGEGSRIQWHGPFVFAGTQFALLLGFWFIVWVAALIAHRPWREANPSLRYLWWLSVPMFCVFLGFGFKTGGGEPNWPVTAYVSGLVLVAGWLMRQLQEAEARRRRWLIGGMVGVCGVGFVLSVFLQYSELVHPLLAKVGQRVLPADPYVLRRFDPTCRLRGWQALAGEVDRLQAELRAKGEEPILATSSWSLAGEVGFYCEGHPTVYSVGLAGKDRHSQYDFWRPNPIADVDQFQGRTFILIGDLPSDALRGFASCAQSSRIEHAVGGFLVNGWTIRVCRGFHGFPARSDQANH